MKGILCEFSSVQTVVNIKRPKMKRIICEYQASKHFKTTDKEHNDAATIINIPKFSMVSGTPECKKRKVKL